MVNPTWEERDLPVLRAAVQLCDESGSDAKPSKIAQVCGFDDDTVNRALVALNNEHPPLFRKMTVASNRTVLFVFDPTGEARRRVGLWPTPEALADRLILALGELAEREPDEEKRGWLRKTADYVKSGGRDLAVDVMAAVLKRQIGLE